MRITKNTLATIAVAALITEFARAQSPPPVFTHSPLELNAVRAITPLGNLNPRGGHVFPTDHIYFDYNLRVIPVYAPAKGVVYSIRGQSGNDYKVEVRVNDHLFYYLGHLFVEETVTVGRTVEAGQIVGKTSGRGMFDLGVFDTQVTLKGFANPERYPLSTTHAVSPFKLFVDPIKSSLYAKVQRAGNDKDGRIDFDIPGKLVGNWFHESLNVRDSSRGGPQTWEKQLAFVYDVRQPGELRISIGGTVAPVGVYQVLDGPDPAKVSMASGKVSYRVRSFQGSAKEAILLVQMTADDRVTAQFFAEPPAAPEFTSAAQIYVR